MPSKKKSVTKNSKTLDSKSTEDLNEEVDKLKNLWLEVSTKIAELKTQIEPLEKERDNLVVKIHETCSRIKLNKSEEVSIPKNVKKMELDVDESVKVSKKTI